MSELTKQDLYDVYQTNLKMCEIQIDLIKEKTMQILGEMHWKKQNKLKDSRIGNLESKLEAAERMCVFIIANWFELRLYKIIYEDSSVAFTNNEIEQLLGEGSLKRRWERSFEISVGKIPNQRGQETFDRIRLLFSSEYLSMVDAVITTRNRLAHGQWKVQLNSSCNRVSTPELRAHKLNIMQLTELWSKLKLIAEFLETFVIYKEKSTGKFQQKIDNLVEKIDRVDSRIESKNYDKYIEQAIRKFENQKNTHENNEKRYHSRRLGRAIKHAEDRRKNTHENRRQKRYSGRPGTPRVYL